MKIYRQPFYKTFIMVILGTFIITSVILFPVIVERFNMALSNGVEIDYLIKYLYFIFVPYIIFYHLHYSVQLFFMSLYQVLE